MLQAESKNKTVTLPLMESFLTVQGEGFHTGSAAYFIRLGGCDVGCVWCDVKESWNEEDHPQKSIQSIIEETVASKTNMVVITGGEPLMYNLDTLTNEMKESGLKTHVETSGVYPLTGKWDWICFSPKKFKEPREEFYKSADELKVIVFNKSDLDWAETHAAKMNDNAHLFLQPEWSKRNQMMPHIVEYVKRNPKWRISLQTHKYLDIP